MDVTQGDVNALATHPRASKAAAQPRYIQCNSSGTTAAARQAFVFVTTTLLSCAHAGYIQLLPHFHVDQTKNQTHIDPRLIPHNVIPGRSPGRLRSSFPPATPSEISSQPHPQGEPCTSYKTCRERRVRDRRAPSKINRCYSSCYCTRPWPVFGLSAPSSSRSSDLPAVPNRQPRSR